MKQGNGQNGKLPIFKNRLEGIKGELSVTDFAEKLGLSRQTTGFYLNGNRIPDILTLRQICEECNVSADYLLGLSDVKSSNLDVKAAVELTGLSEASIQYLHFLNQIDSTEYAYAIDQLVSDCKVHNYDNNKKRDYRAILGLLAYFFAYQNRGVDKIVYSNGFIIDRPHPNRIPSNAIALDDTIIENAVLAEIQHALINLKRAERENAKNSTD